MPSLIGLALLVPLLFASAGADTPFYLGLPRVHSGDEVHYLVSINSVISDGDLDLANNYASVHAGSEQAGKASRRRALDHHTVWFEGGSRRTWASVYEQESARWGRNEHGDPVPRLREGQAPPPPDVREFSTHPPGLALLLAPVLLAVRGTTYVEPLAIACSAAAVVLAMLMYCALVRKYVASDRMVYLAAAVAFLGTPAWHYARTLFTEPYLLLCAIGAYSLALRGRSPLLAGAFIGVGLLLKPPSALLILPLIAMYLVARDLPSAARLVAPVAAALMVYLALNHYMFGSPWTVAQEWWPGSLIRGAAGSLIHIKYGFLIVAPAIIAAFIAWPAFFRAFPRDATVLGAGILLQFGLYASYGGWTGATCYAARHFVPLLPLIFVPLVKLPDTALWQRRWLRHGVIAICIMSIALNGIAAMAYWKYWDTNPALIAIQWLWRSVGA